MPNGWEYLAIMPEITLKVGGGGGKLMAYMFHVLLSMLSLKYSLFFGYKILSGGRGCTQYLCH